jgi:predicted transcriptional regulator
MAYLRSLFRKPAAGQPDYVGGYSGFVRRLEWNMHSNNNLIKNILPVMRNEIFTLSASDHLTDVYEYLQDKPFHTVPILVNNKCVGLVGRQELNLHLSPTMGTDMETTKESKIWKKPLNQLMRVEFTHILNTTNVIDLPLFIKENNIFPWIVNDEKGEYIGIIFK